MQMALGDVQMFTVDFTNLKPMLTAACLRLLSCMVTEPI